MPTALLPRGVALVRVTTPHRKVVVVSARLSHDQALAARVLACALAQHGSPYVMVTMPELLAALHDAAA